MDTLNIFIGFDSSNYGQELAYEVKCLTIETFSDQILDLLEDLYGSVPIRVCLKKCSPPVSGFSGTVAIERTRNFQSLN